MLNIAKALQRLLARLIKYLEAKLEKEEQRVLDTIDRKERQIINTIDSLMQAKEKNISDGVDKVSKVSAKKAEVQALKKS